MADKQKRCADCGDDFYKHKLTPVGVCLVCDGCLNDHHTECNDCSDIVHNDNINEIYNGDMICQSCFDNEYFKCNDCEELDHQDNRYSTDSDWIVCESCFNDHYSYCDDCGNMCHTVDMYGDYCSDCDSNNDDGGCTCSDCSGTSSGGIHPYGFRPKLIFHKRKREKNCLYLGIELEMESRKGDTQEQAESLKELDTDEKLFYLCRDATINQGFEIITHPATLAYHLNNFPWKRLCKLMVKMGARSHNTNTCGLHVHVNKDYFSQSDLVKLGLFIHSLEKPMSFLSRRKRNRWGNFKDIRHGKDKIHKNGDRYEAINFQNPDTVEFRLYKGSLNYETVLATIDFTAAICCFVKSVGPSKIVNKKAETWKDFIEFSKNHKHKHFLAYLKSRIESHGKDGEIPHIDKLAETDKREELPF